MAIDPLAIDVYAEDCNGTPNWVQLIAAGAPWHVGILKATEGLHYAPNWFPNNWRALSLAAGNRRGVDFFRGAYHYLRVDEDPVAQSDTFLDFVRDAGGFAAGDLPPIVDVERASNADASAQQVIDATSRFAAEIKRELGCEPILYGGEFLAYHGITDHLGCQKLFLARYSATLPAEVYQRIGWQLPDVFAWQYCGDGEAYLPGYPAVSPLGRTDISAVIVNGGGDGAIAWMRANGVR